MELVLVLELARIHRAHPRTSPEKMVVSYEDFAAYSRIWRSLPPEARAIVAARIPPPT